MGRSKKEEIIRERSSTFAPSSSCVRSLVRVKFEIFVFSLKYSQLLVKTNVKRRRQVKSGNQSCRCADLVHVPGVVGRVALGSHVAGLAAVAAKRSTGRAAGRRVLPAAQLNDRLPARRVLHLSLRPNGQPGESDDQPCCRHSEEKHVRGCPDGLVN